MSSTPKPSPEYLAAARAYARAVELVEQRRQALAPLLIEEVRRGVMNSVLAREAGYTPQHVARIARLAGVEPRVERTPPTRRTSPPPTT